MDPHLTHPYLNGAHHSFPSLFTSTSKFNTIPNKKIVGFVMGNHKFRLSGMLLNSWFYKLKDMGTKTAKTHQKNHSLPPITTISPPQQPKSHHHLHHPRQSYHFPRDDSPQGPFHNNLDPTHIPDPPRKSAKKRRSTSKRTPKKSSPRLVTSSVSADCSCSRASIESIWTKPDSATEDYPNSITSSEIGSDHGSLEPSHSHILCNFTNSQNDTTSKAKSKNFKTLDLPRIITKKTEANQTRTTTANKSTSVKVMKEDTVGISRKEQRTSTSPLRKYSPSSPGMKLRTNSPRIGTRKVQASHRKSFSLVPTSRRNDSFAVVKSSKDPQREFKESMVEMIIENKIKTSKELEELLACYLSLNSDEYHHIIIKVFKQIWFDTIDIRLK